MYETDPSDPDAREQFLLSAKIYENEGAFISISESFPSEIAASRHSSFDGNKGDHKDGDLDGPGAARIGGLTGAGTKKRCDSEDLLTSSAGAEMFAKQKGGYVAKLERQVDNSFFLCLNTCRYCDYDHGHYQCSTSVVEREVGLRVKHSIKKSKFTGDTEIKFVNVALPTFVPSFSASKSSSSCGRLIAKPGTKRAIWCPRTLKNEVYARSKDSVGSNLDFETASVTSKHSAASKGSMVSSRSGKPLGPHRVSSFNSKTMNELVQGSTDLCDKCMSKIPDWNPKINSLVTKFHDNRIRFPSSHNVIVYEEATLQEYKSVLKSAVTAAAALKESAPPQEPPKVVGGTHSSPFGKIGNFFSRKEKEPEPPKPSAPETKTLSKTLSADSAIFQFGKNNERSEEYALDFRGPLSPLQAFAIAMSSFADEMVVNYISLNAIALARARKKKRGSISSTSTSGSGDADGSVGGSPSSARKSLSSSGRRKVGKDKSSPRKSSEGSSTPAAPVTIFVPGAKPPPPPPMQRQNSGGTGEKKKRRPSITDIISSLTSTGSADATPEKTDASDTSTKPKRRTSLTQLFGSKPAGDEDTAPEPENVVKKSSWASKMFGGGSTEKVGPPPPPSGGDNMPPAPPVSVDTANVGADRPGGSASTPLSSSGPLVRIPAQGDVFRAQQAARIKSGAANIITVAPSSVHSSSSSINSNIGRQVSSSNQSQAAGSLPRPTVERSRSNSVSSTSSSMSHRSNQTSKHSTGPVVDVSSGLEGSGSSGPCSVVSAGAYTPLSGSSKSIPPATAAYIEKRKNLANLTGSNSNGTGTSIGVDDSTAVAQLSSLAVSESDAGCTSESPSAPFSQPSTPNRKNTPPAPTITTAGGISTPTKKIHHPPVRSPAPPGTRRQTPLTSPIARTRKEASPMGPTPSSGTAKDPSAGNESVS